jgi:hypothetical protein
MLFIFRTQRRSMTFSRLEWLDEKSASQGLHALLLQNSDRLAKKSFLSGQRVAIVPPGGHNGP